MVLKGIEQDIPRTTIIADTTFFEGHISEGWVKIMKLLNKAGQLCKADDIRVKVLTLAFF